MATPENILDRARSLNPTAESMIKDFISMAGSEGLVIFTEDMTDDEKEMAVFESLLREGYTAQEADREAKKRLKTIKAIFSQV
ncbi:MAG: hypothetical protein QW561_00160 [Candidatus Aenigmatarchaeota archaeon]